MDCRTPTAEGDTRTLSFHHIHTNEDLTITYKVNGRYDDEALKKINWIMRDWRKNESIAMDPHTIDILWDVHREVSAKEPIWIICGYRSPNTNAMLRRRSNGVAKFSQHMLGKAVDFYIPGVPLDQLREAGLRAQRGGVGFYPTSGSPFVHMDTGSVRHWPRMPEAQLARVLAKGPLPRAGSDRTTQVAALPNPIAPISKLMGLGSRAPAVASNTETAQTVAAAESKTVKPVVVAAAVPLPRVKPAAKPAPVTYEVASVTSKPVQLPPARTASLVAPAATPTSAMPTSAMMSPNSIISERGFWQGLPETNAPQTIPAARTAAPARRPAATQVASAEPVTTASLAPWPLPERIARRHRGRAGLRADNRTRGLTDIGNSHASHLRRAQRRAGHHRCGQAQRQSAFDPVDRSGCSRRQRQARRAVQRAVDARHDREPERARLHEHVAARHARLPQPQRLPAKADRFGDDDLQR